MDAIEASENGRFTLLDFMDYLRRGVGGLRHADTVIRLLDGAPKATQLALQDKSPKTPSSMFHITNFNKALDFRPLGHAPFRRPSGSGNPVRDAQTQTKEEENVPWFRCCFRRDGVSSAFDPPRSPWSFSPRTPA